jgi:hypothetical protein
VDSKKGGITFRLNLNFLVAGLHEYMPVLYLLKVDIGFVVMSYFF